MAQRGLYQPKIADEHIRQLSQWAKRLEIPMTRLVNALLAHALIRLEQGGENVNDPPVGGDPRKQRKKRRARYGRPVRKSAEACGSPERCGVTVGTSPAVARRQVRRIRQRRRADKTYRARRCVLRSRPVYLADGSFAPDRASYESGSCRDAPTLARVC